MCNAISGEIYTAEKLTAWGGILALLLANCMSLNNN